MDSLSTSAGTEDHVSMGGFAARKALQVVRNVEKVIDTKWVLNAGQNCIAKCLLNSGNFKYNVVWFR